MTWDWNEEKTARWLEPAMEIPWLTLRWKKAGFKAVLDNGCGPGRHAMFFAREGLSATGMDKSDQAREYLTAWAKAENLPVSVVEGNILKMPFESGSFDAVLDYNASYHMCAEDFYHAISEIHRVLKPGGELYMTLLSQNDVKFKSAPPEDHLDEFTLSHAGSTPHFYGKKESLGEIFAGFQPISVREIKASAIDSGEERIHFHLLLRKR